MRVAVCLSGQLRTCNTAAPGILRFFKDLNPDYFIHTWFENEWHDKDSDKINIAETEQIEYESCLKATQLFNPTAVILESNTVKQFEVPVSQAQQYSMMRANQIKRKHEQLNSFTYDLVIKCRFDLIWPPNEKIRVPIEIDPNGLYVSYVDYKQNKELPMILDRYFYGSSKTMDTIANIYNETCERIKFSELAEPQNDPTLMPEAMLYQYCMDKKISILPMACIEVIVRKNAIGLDHLKDFIEIRSIHNNFYVK